MHDNIGQLLTLAKIQLQSATPNNIKEVSETITKGLSEVRSLSKLINPEAMKKIDLKEAIQLEIDRFNRLKFISLKPLIFLGHISYALYLIHQNFGYVILNKLYAYYGSHQILILIPIICSIIIAFIITEYLEKPICKYLRNKF